MLGQRQSLLGEQRAWQGPRALPAPSQPGRWALTWGSRSPCLGAGLPLVAKAAVLRSLAAGHLRTEGGQRPQTGPSSGRAPRTVSAGHSVCVQQTAGHVDSPLQDCHHPQSGDAGCKCAGRDGLGPDAVCGARRLCPESEAETDPRVWGKLVPGPDALWATLAGDPSGWGTRVAVSSSLRDLAGPGCVSGSSEGCMVCRAGAGPAGGRGELCLGCAPPSL